MEPRSTEWKDSALEWGLIILTAPIWLPSMIVTNVRLRARTAPLVQGHVEQAWQRCSAVWRDVGMVCQEAPSGYGVPFAHQLALAFARRHRSHPQFLLGKLLDQDPLLAAYAFKCLIRVCDLGQQDLPSGALGRTDLIRVQAGRYVDEQPLGDFFKVYFLQKERGQAVGGGLRANWWRWLRW